MKLLLILLLTKWYTGLKRFQRKNGCTIYNWNHDNILTAEVRWILEWSRYTLLRWFWFLSRGVVPILKWTAFRWINLKCLSNVEAITTQTDTQIWHYAFIAPPLKITIMWLWRRMIINSKLPVNVVMIF